MVNEGSSSSITAPATASSSSMKSSDVSQSSAAKSLPKEKKRPVGNGIAEGAVKKKKVCRVCEKGKEERRGETRVLI